MSFGADIEDEKLKKENGNSGGDEEALCSDVDRDGSLGLDCFRIG